MDESSQISEDFPTNPLTTRKWALAFPYFSTRLVINLLKFGEIISEDFGWWSTTGMLFVRHLRTRSVVAVKIDSLSMLCIPLNGAMVLP